MRAMAGRSSRRVALFSIKPRYAAAILEGRKKIELRRGHVPPDLTDVVIYASSPRREIVGRFVVDRIECSSPSALWARWGPETGVTREEFRKYFRGATTARGIVVRAATQFAEPVALASVLDDAVPPQSFRYLDEAALDVLEGANR
jgi:predicted transcriptional regulator